MSNLRVLGVVTARGGSKGIPRKNVRDLCGRPLICHTIDTANKSKLLSRSIISTDDTEIAEIAKKCGGEVPFMRPKELAQDESTSIEVIQNVIETLKKEGEKYDYVMILQPTSPLRTAEDIDGCIAVAQKTNADSVMSMKEADDFSAKKMKKIVDGKIEPYFEDEGKESSRRQDLEKAYKRNCAIYLTKTNLILKGDLFGNNSQAYIMPEERSVDINQPVDFELAEFWLKKNKEKNEKI
ncbi:acylneuraminate cytidylyltransferase [bacterium]|nr:acylneuraminate cytidylyltransferase [bacterium]|tara:strand:- start:9572 stop:10288 length:717 start_codon:yes stop_codon:yes gene_type:complete